MCYLNDHFYLLPSCSEETIVELENISMTSTI